MGIAAQISESLAWPARQINSISLGSVCCRSLSTSTYDERVLIGVTAGGVGLAVVGEAVGGLDFMNFGGGAAMFFSRLMILG